MYTYTVYADVLWLVNFALDLLLLWGTARFGGFLTSWPRLLAGAAAGACYGVGLLFPALAPLYAMPLPVLFSLLMLLVTFGRLPLIRWGWLVASFYLLSFAMGGAALGVAALLRRSSYQLFGLHVAELWPALLAAVALARLGIAGFRRLLRDMGLKSWVQLGLGDRQCRLSCFFDTGNTLHEPAFSGSHGGRPVLLAELAALKPLLPPPLWEELRELYRREGAAARPYQLLLRYQSLPGLTGRLVLLPYTAVGESRGLLLGFAPDKLLFTLSDGRQIDSSGRLVVGICPLSLAGLKGCRAIVNPEAVLAAAMTEAGDQPQGAPARPERGLQLPGLNPEAEPAAYPLPPGLDMNIDIDNQRLAELVAEYGLEQTDFGQDGLVLGLVEANNRTQGRISA